MHERPCNRCGNKIIGPTIGGDTCLNCMMRIADGSLTEAFAAEPQRTIVNDALRIVGANELNEENLEAICVQIRAAADERGVKITATPTHVRWVFDWDAAAPLERWHLAYTVQAMPQHKGKKWTIAGVGECHNESVDMRSVRKGEGLAPGQEDMVHIGSFVGNEYTGSQEYDLYFSFRLMDTVDNALAESGNPRTA